MGNEISKPITTTRNQVGIYLFKFNNGNIRRLCGISSELTIKTEERCHCYLYCQLWTDLTHCSGAFILMNKKMPAGICIHASKLI